jgi:hypothetical protein
MHNEKCDNCLCRTVCYFTFPGHELTEEDGECGHYIFKEDVVTPVIKKIFRRLYEESEEYDLGWGEGWLYATTTDKIKMIEKEFLGEE